jgi:hypothetical protein
MLLKELLRLVFVQFHPTYSLRRLIPESTIIEEQICLHPLSGAETPQLTISIKKNSHP